MLREYSCTKSESLAQIHSTMAELQHYFKGLFFYWHTLYIRHYLLVHYINTKCVNVCSWMIFKALILLLEKK